MAEYGGNKGSVTINHDRKGMFIARPNRFLAIVDIDGIREKVHVHDPGRLKELLYPGNEVLVKREEKPGRTTAWDMIAARVGAQWVLVHSGYHRKISEMILRDPELSPLGNVLDLRPEITIGHSRLDFVLSSDGVITGVEVKGCSLAIDGKALFPDAPTTRGKKHLETLIDMKKQGMNAMLLILVFRTDVKVFEPNTETDPLFAKTFWDAIEQGVEAKPMVFKYDGKTMTYVGNISVAKRPGQAPSV